MRIHRLAGNPIIGPSSGRDLGDNVNGPSLVRAPPWLEKPLGRYYLYFAHHQGSYIRLAYSDRLEGPWKLYDPGTLSLEDSYCYDHIASPDVHVDETNQEVRMYYHGWVGEQEQQSKVAVSKDGIKFDALPGSLGEAYFRVFRWNGYHYALGMPGVFYRSKNGLTGFDEGPTLFSPDMRHSAVSVVGGKLEVFYTNAGDCPERIFHSTVDLTPDWMEWRESEPEVVLEPETEYEGADLPLAPSVRGAVMERVRQVRDPAIYQEGMTTYLLYSVGGEQGIALAELY